MTDNGPATGPLHLRCLLVLEMTFFRGHIRGERRCIVLALLLLVIGIALPSASTAACAYVPDHFELRPAGEERWQVLASRLVLPSRLRVTDTEVRFWLPPTPAACWLTIERASLIGLAVSIDGGPEQQFSFLRPGAAEAFSTASFVMPLPASAGPTVVSLQVRKLGVFSPQIDRVNTAELLHRERRTQSVHVISVVVPGMMLLLVGLFWFKLRDRALAAYIAFALTLVLITSSLDGTLYTVPVLRNLAALNVMAHILLLSLFGLAAVVFFRAFLAPLDSSARRWLLLLTTWFALTGTSSLVWYPPFSGWVQHVGTAGVTVMAPLLLWQAWRCHRAGNPSAIYFLVGWSLPLLAIPVRLLGEYGVIENTFWIRYAPRVAFLFEALVFGLGLADRALRLRIERDRADQARLHTEVTLASFRQLAHADALTGAASRRALDAELERWNEAAIAGCVLFADLDHFKSFNDRYGHASGDEALRAIACQLREALPAGAMLARYGGEEFVALLSGATRVEAIRVAEAARQAVEATTAANGPRAITISIGTAERRAAEPMAETLARSDAALYRAKAAGRNRVHEG